MGVNSVMYTYIKMDALLPTIMNNIKLLINVYIFKLNSD